MRVEDLKRWHWILIAIFIGLAYSYLRVSMEPPRNPRSTKSPQFEQALFQAPLKSGESFISDIVILPPEDGKYLVNFKMLKPTKDNKAWQPEPYCFYAETPYKPQHDKPAQPDPNETIVSYLSRMKSRYPQAKYTYAWWREPKWTFTIFTLGSVVVIGGVWPTLINLLIGAGFGRGRQVEQPEYDLSRFGKGGPPKPVLAAAKQMTDEEEQKLRALEEELERNLFAARGARPETPLTAPAPAPEIRKLDAGPLDAPTPQPKKPEDDKQYAGEFYPTIAHAPPPKKK